VLASDEVSQETFEVVHATSSPSRAPRKINWYTRDLPELSLPHASQTTFHRGESQQERGQTKDALY
jgi:hypothetical protein